MFDAEVSAVTHDWTHTFISPNQFLGQTAIQYLELGSANEPPVHVPTHTVVLLSPYVLASQDVGGTQFFAAFA